MPCYSKGIMTRMVIMPNSGSINKAGKSQSQTTSQQEPPKRLYKLQKWGARLVSLLKKHVVRKTPYSKWRAAKAKLETLKSEVINGNVQHIIKPDRAMQTLAYQAFRDGKETQDENLQKYLKKDSPVQVEDNNSEMKVIQSIGEGSSGSIKAVIPGQAGPVNVRKDNICKNNKHFQLLKAEEKILQELDHPNIIKAATGREVTKAEPSIYMEHGGTTLTEYIKASIEFLPEGPQSEKAYLSRAKQSDLKFRESIFSQVLEGLAYMNSKGIVHRDIKPDNILFNPGDKRVRIADFGSATKISNKKAMKSAAGSPFYFAPEMMSVYTEKGHSYGVEVDMFSVGCIFYEMVTGETYLRLNEGRNVNKILTNELRTLKRRNLQEWLTESINPKLFFSMNEKGAAKMVKLLRGMLEVDPTKRFTPAQAQAVLKGSD